MLYGTESSVVVFYCVLDQTHFIDVSLCVHCLCFCVLRTQ